jgi:hypothetical protein
MYKRPASIDEDLLQIRLEAEQLQGLVGMLVDEPAGVRDIWHWQWDGLMERFQRLCRLHQQGLIPDALEVEFLAVSRMLADGRELIEALGCNVPPEIHDLSFIDAPSTS